METRLRQVADEGVRSLVVRAGDFFGPNAGNNWFAQGLVKPGRVPSSIAYPGTRGVGHQWAYLPDVAETMARLVEREDALDAFETFHMDGHWDGDGTMMTGAIQRVYGESASKLGRFPWWLIRLAQPFVPMFREIMEMRYLWQVPLRLSNARLVALLGNEPHTPLDRAVQATLAGQGCLPGGSAGVQGVLTS
jgi:nucleoside-diphosphate-sugar epimerase